MSDDPTFRPLTGPVIFAKLNKYAPTGIAIEEIAKRINFSNQDRIQELLNLLGNRPEFLLKVHEINAEIRMRKKHFNSNRVLQALRSIPIISPIKIEQLSTSIGWIDLPKYLIPEMMCLGVYHAGKRKDWTGLVKRLDHCKRKRMQISSILNLMKRFLNEQDRTKNVKVLDLCGGRGDLALFLAHKFPHWTITIMDRNKEALSQAVYRADMLGLRNLTVRQVDLFDLNVGSAESWDVVIGLHACGSLTEIILSKFRTRAKHLLVATCCFGKMKPPHAYSRYADADNGGRNTETSRLAKLVINSERGRDITGFEVLEVDEKFFSSKNQILHVVS
jgi:hypothetical protein